MIGEIEYRDDAAALNLIATKAGIRKLVERLEARRPDFDLPVPPSDNRRLIAAKWTNRQRGSAPRLVLSTVARTYMSNVKILDKRLPMTPEDGVEVIMVVRPFFKNKLMDPGNIKKTLEDSMFTEDRHVHTWILPVIFDKENPRVHVWLMEFRRGDL